MIRPYPYDDKGYLVQQRGEYRRSRQSGLYVRDQPMVRAFDPVSSGQAHIPRDWDLTINGTTVSPTCVYLASDINTGTGAWAEHFGTAAGAMALQAGSPTYDVASLLGVGGGDDEGVKGDGTAYWQPAGTAFGDVATEDTIIELLFLGASGAKTLFCKRGATGAGFEIYTNIGSVYLYVEDDSANSVNKQLGTVVPGAAYHLLIVMDRNGGASGLSAYLNNASAAVANIDAVATLTNAAALTICAKSTAATPWDSTASAAGLWMSAPGWLDAGSQADLAAERFWRWCGIYPQLAPRGAYLPTFTRSTTKYFYRSDQSLLHLGGAGLLAVDDQGVHIEGAATNIILQSQTFGTTWAKADAGDAVVDDAAVAPDGTTTADSLAADATYGSHALLQNATLTAATWVVSCYMKKGASDWGLVYVTTATEGKYFNLATGALGSDVNSPVASGIENVGNGWYRCWVAVNGVAGLHNIQMFTAGGDGTANTSGDGSTPNIYLWGAQVELGTYPSSYIPTTTAAVTRNADNLDLNSAIADRLNTAGEGTIECEVKLPDHDLQPYPAIWTLSDGTGNNYIQVYLHKTGDKTYGQMTAGGVSQATIADLVDIVDGSWHAISMAWRTGRLSLVVDGTETTDTSCTMPAGLNELNIGQNYAGTGQLNGRIRNLKIWDYARH